MDAFSKVPDSLVATSATAERAEDNKSAFMLPPEEGANIFPKTSRYYSHVSSIAVCKLRKRPALSLRQYTQYACIYYHATYHHLYRSSISHVISAQSVRPVAQVIV